MPSERSSKRTLSKGKRFKSLVNFILPKVDKKPCKDFEAPDLLTFPVTVLCAAEPDVSCSRDFVDQVRSSVPYEDKKHSRSVCKDVSVASRRATSGFESSSAFSSTSSSMQCSASQTSQDEYPCIVPSSETGKFSGLSSSSAAVVDASGWSRRSTTVSPNRTTTYYTPLTSNRLATSSTASEFNDSSNACSAVLTSHMPGKTLQKSPNSNADCGCSTAKCSTLEGSVHTTTSEVLQMLCGCSSSSSSLSTSLDVGVSCSISQMTVNTPDDELQSQTDPRRRELGTGSGTLNGFLIWVPAGHLIGGHVVHQAVADGVIAAISRGQLLQGRCMGILSEGRYSRVDVRRYSRAPVIHGSGPDRMQLVAKMVCAAHGQEAKVQLSREAAFYCRLNGSRVSGFAHLVAVAGMEDNGMVEALLLEEMQKGACLIDFVRRCILLMEGRRLTAAGYQHCCAAILVQIARALEGLHLQLEVVHNDVKPENIIVSGNPFNPNGLVVQVIDLGLAKTLKEMKRLRSFSGTVPYGSPEKQLMYATSARSRCLGFHEDVWGLGAVMFVLFSMGRVPNFESFYPQEQQQATMARLRKGIPLPCLLNQSCKHCFAAQELHPIMHAALQPLPVRPDMTCIRLRLEEWLANHLNSSRKGHQRFMDIRCCAVPR